MYTGGNVIIAKLHPLDFKAMMLSFRNCKMSTQMLLVFITFYATAIQILLIQPADHSPKFRLC
jgi:hypothetical protein